MLHVGLKNDKQIEGYFELLRSMCKWKTVSFVCVYLLSFGWESCTYAFAWWLYDMWYVDVMLHAETWVLRRKCKWTMCGVFAVLWQHKYNAVVGIVQEWNSLFSWGSAILRMKKVYCSSLSTSQTSCCSDCFQRLKPWKGLIGIFNSHWLRTSSISSSFFHSCDWPDCLKWLYRTEIFSSTHCFTSYMYPLGHSDSGVFGSLLDIRRQNFQNILYKSLQNLSQFLIIIWSVWLW